MITSDDALIVVRRAAVIAIEPAFDGQKQVDDHCFVSYGGVRQCVRHSLNHVLELVWDRDGDHE